MVLVQGIKGIIYYTSNKLGDPLFSLVQRLIEKPGFPITSSSLKPIDFGDNEVHGGEPGYITMTEQIISCLERSVADYVFFCEHDVLYPESHFDFIPERDDIFYYNDHVWRWKIGGKMAITYDRLISLSGMCANRELALSHYYLKLGNIYKNGLHNFKSREPSLARKWGYEPGTKKKKRGGLTDEDFATWTSEHPIVDVRHSKTFSPIKVTLDSFKHLPKNWREIPVEEIPGWNIKELFNE